MGKDENQDQYKGTRRFVNFILGFITFGIILMSIWYYSEMVTEYTGDAFSGIIGSVYDEISCC